MPNPSAQSPDRPVNALLRRLPKNEYEEVCSHTTIWLPVRHDLVRLPGSSETIYFPRRGVYAICHRTADGRTVGVALVGNEGVIGLPEFGGDPESGMWIMPMMRECDTDRMSAEVFRTAMKRLPVFHDVIHRYAQAFGESLMQSIACNAVHSIEQRCARCLLEIHDRVGRRDLPLTHELLADLLGVRRESITVAAGLLERAGLIERRRRQIRVADPDGLMAAACECYVAIKGHFARFLP
jgi:CRP-like cAMP-binding protein